MGIVERIICRFAPEILFGFQMRDDAVALSAVQAACGGGIEARLAADEKVPGGGVTGAEIAGARGEARVAAKAVVERGAAAGDKRRDKQNAQSHGAVRALRAPLTALPEPPLHSRAASPTAPRGPTSAGTDSASVPAPKPFKALRFKSFCYIAMCYL